MTGSSEQRSLLTSEEIEKIKASVATEYLEELKNSRRIGKTESEIATKNGVLPIPFVQEEKIFPIAIHGGTGIGKSTAQVDILTWAKEEGIVSQIASNIKIGIRESFEGYFQIEYLTDLLTFHNAKIGKGVGMDELNRSLDGREWEESKRKVSAQIVDNSRRNGVRILVATSIRLTGIDVGLRLSMRGVIEPTGKQTNDGYPIYKWFQNYPAYEAYLADPERTRGYVFYRGFHTVEQLKNLFDSVREPKLEGYPPIDVDVCAKEFLDSAGSIVWTQKGSLVNQRELSLHLGVWNRKTHFVAYSHADLDSILSKVLGLWNSKEIDAEMFR